MRNVITIFGGGNKRAQARRPALLLLAICFLTPMFAPGFAQSHNGAGRASGEKLFCGYDPSGALDQWYNHKLNLIRFNEGRSPHADLSTKSLPAATVEDRNDIAVIQDNGGIVMPPNKFDLGNQSLLFTPEGDGFRITRDSVAFTKELGSRLTFFSARAAHSTISIMARGITALRARSSLSTARSTTRFS